MSRIHRKHYAAALVGAAAIAGAASLPFAVNSSNAFAAPSDTGGILAASGSFASIVDADKPAVVTITTTMKASDASAGQESPMDEQFRQFFEDQGIPLPRPAPQHHGSEHAMALGSGFIISPDGVIVTNNHVIDNAFDIKATLDDGTELPAKLIGTDAKSDVAVLKIEAGKPLQTIAWGDSDRLKLGDQILAIGNPFGIGTTVTAGIVSARGRDLHSGPYDDFIQIDAPINHGNSGGPLVDREGKVVGINTAIYSPNGGSVGVGFAIPSDEAKAIVAKLEKNGSIDHGYLGVQIQPVTKDVADAVGLDKTGGALVAAVSANTPAANAGLKPGDIVTSVGGETVKTPKDLSRLVADLSPGTNEALGVWRDGRTIDLNVTVGANADGQKQAEAESPQAHGQAFGQPSLGIGLADLTPDVRQQLNLPRSVSGAVVASVNPDKSAAAAGIQSGDVIVSVNDRPVRNARDVKAAIAEAGKAGRKSVLLLVERDGSKTFIAVPFAAA
ncbi:DegQ family serine endoprotease [Rhizobium bangladeshense]|uniref:DegQ family serine endoprotease n=1 Tax=Rhizobium bangladeshense TaxID=1138189 RepID=UPI001A993998|nr:DegQ family serine endoprotease [Rhizobium bangladeshense]MBX4892040.1 DegQ family serine endoprotease [Rhizobium bangladeshense]MBX4914016.1 DegQ family serine endoprotease [Rhizobium bangladeshense]MBX4919682.1 DegQ family serine endoprotease [Rhizobium bangladeshense]MBX4932092.1 DegQ family serine endoprotease [Rhizobium bangladeshense]QSY89595.1 DegQ family serine endoprotease [Rhizobium bangladeshense]